MSDPVTAFVWAHLARRLERAGVEAAHAADLSRLVRVEPEELADASTATGGTEGAAPPAGATGQRRARFELLFRQGELSVELNAYDGTPLSWGFPDLAAMGGAAPDAAGALAAAEQAADLPPGATLAHAAFEEINGRPVFVAHWEHHEEGVRVERDYVRVLVSGANGRVFAVQRRWHDVDLRPTER